MPTVCIAGKNSIAVHGLRRAIQLVGEKNVRVCTTETDNGSSGWQPSLARHASECNVIATTLQECQSIQDLIFLSLEFDKIIDPRRFASGKLFNIHFSLLPRNKGMYTSAWPILNGERFSGTTLHVIDYGIDTGPIIAQDCFALQDCETARSLYFKYLQSAASLLDKNFQQILSGEFKTTPQSAIESNYHSRSSINYKNLAINVRETASQISRQIRAFTFPEYQTAVISGFPIARCNITGQRSTEPPGTLSIANPNTAILSTIDYDLTLYRDRQQQLLQSTDDGDEAGVQQAIEHGVNPDATNRHGWTSLMIACYKGNLKIIQQLLLAGANPNATNQNGTTVLMYAKEGCIASGSFQACDLLITAGASVHQEDHFGRNVLDYARNRNQSAAIEYFERKK